MRKGVEEAGGICLLSQLKAKEVISIEDGKRLGHIADVEVDLRELCITALILVRDGGRLTWFDERQEVRIPWEKIERIGEDVVLVKAEMIAERRDKKGFRFFGKKE